MKRYKTPLALVVVLLLLAGLAYWDDAQTLTDKKVTEEKSRLYDFHAEDIVAISATNAHAEPSQWLLKKDAGSWQVVSPLVYSADSNGIERFLKIIADARYERDFDIGAQDRDGFGLARPQLLYRLSDKNGKSWLLAMGSKSPTGYSSYLQKDDSKHVFLVNQYLATAATKSLNDFRDRSLALPPANLVTHVEIVWHQLPALAFEQVKGAGKEGKETAKGGEPAWEIVTPIRSMADGAEIKKYLSAWEQLRVLDFIDAPPPALRQALSDLSKGTKEYVRATFSRGKLPPKSITILENNGKLYVKLGADTFAEVDRQQVDELKKSVNDLQDRTIFTFISADAIQLTIDGKVYTKAAESWIEASNKKPAPFAQGVVVSLEFAKADAKISAEEALPATVSTALHQVEIKEKNKAPTQFSLWTNPSDKSSLVLKNGDQYYKVGAEFPEILKPRAEVHPGQLGGEVKSDKS